MTLFINVSLCFNWFTEKKHLQNVIVSENKALKSKFSQQNKKSQVNYIFMNRKDWKFCDQMLKAVAILNKKFKLSSLFFSILNSYFLKIFSFLIFHSAVTFQQYQLCFIFFKYLKSYSGSKN